MVVEAGGRHDGTACVPWGRAWARSAAAVLPTAATPRPAATPLPCLIAADGGEGGCICKGFPH